MENIIAFQPKLSRLIPKVVNNKDYFEYQTLIERIDEILNVTGFDLEFAWKYIDTLGNQGRKELTQRQIERYTKYSITALRCMIIKNISQKGFRELSVSIGESSLLQWFCQIENINNTIKVPSKSALQRFTTVISEGELNNLIRDLFEKTSSEDNPLDLVDPFNSEDIYFDATCLKSNIHFPVDWLLLHDGMITIIKSILVIRKHGLKHRIKSPEKFITQVNGLCIEMTHTRRKKNSQTLRKNVLRRMKRVSKVIRAHGDRYRNMLKNEWKEKTDLSEGQVRVIVERIDNVLEKLPKAIEQAHSRIITGLKIDSKNKILSLYDDSVRVVKRGKAGAEVEFGNTLFLAEQSNGFIVDWKLYNASAPSDSNLAYESLERIAERELDVNSVTGDRGCDSKKCRKFIKQRKMYNALCPRNPQEFIERLQDEKFRKHQKRRSQTEARIGIFKNDFLGSPIKNKKFEYKEMSVAWAVLTHNLWILARMDYDQEKMLAKTA
jgi:hypothetical protein